MASQYTFSGRAGIAKVTRRTDADGTWWVLSVRGTERRFGDENEAQRAAYRAAFGAPEGTKFGRCELCFERERQLHDVREKTDLALSWVCGPCGSELVGEDDDPRTEGDPCGCNGGCSACLGVRSWSGF